MARTKTRPAAAPSAAHAAPDPAPAPDTAAAPGSPAAAVHAALAASPGSAIAVIADAAGTGKPAARAALLAMEKAGTATRVKGGKPGIPDTWTLADPAPDGAGPAADPEDEQGGQPGDGPAGSPDGAGEDETGGGPARTGPPGPAAPRHRTATPRAGTSAAPDPGDGKARAARRPRRRRPRGRRPGRAGRRGRAGQRRPAGPGRRRRPARRGRPGGRRRRGWRCPGPGPRHGDLTGRIAQIKAAADAAASWSWPGAGTCEPRWRAWTRSPSRPPRRGGR